MNFRGWQAAKMVMMALIVHLFGGQMDCQLALMHYWFAEARGARGGDQNSVCQAGATQD